jgi:hypothetical protein
LDFPLCLGVPETLRGFVGTWKKHI